MNHNQSRSKPKHQHWVPRFYLNYFATPETKASSNPKTYVIYKKDNIPEARLTSTRTICGQRYLYSPTDERGDRDWSFEDILGKMESNAADYWGKLALAEIDLEDPENRDQLSKFLAALHLRNKYIADLIANIMKKRDALFGGPKAKSTTGKQEIVHPHQLNPDPTDPTRFFVQKLHADIPRIAETFSSYNWALLRCCEEVLVTSDMPITFINNLSRRSGPGGKNPAAIFPISPSSLLYVWHSDGNPATKTKEVEPAFLRHMNNLIYSFSLRLVVTKFRPSD